MPCVLVLGLGDLGLRIAERLASIGGVGRLVLAGRNIARGEAYAELLAASNGVDIEFRELDCLSVVGHARLLRSEKPDLVIQAASYVSPWSFARLEGEAASALQRVGFGVQLPFQLPCLRACMCAVRDVAFSGPVVNCSYPDATHVILDGEGLAPTIGIGNAAMMQAWIERALRRAGRDDLVRLVAHHVQTVSVLSSVVLPPNARPWVFVGEAGHAEHDLAYRGPSIGWSEATNTLSAAVAVRAIRALVDGASPVRLSSPGPLGLPGGYPVRISSTGVELDLPGHLSLEAAMEHNRSSARAEGLASIEQGVATWTDEAAASLRLLGPQFAEPLDSSNVLERAKRMAHALGLNP